MKHILSISLIFIWLSFPDYLKAQNNALNFDGTDDYVSISGLNLAGATAFTVEAWVYPRTFNSSENANITNLICCIGSSTAQENVILRLGDSDRPNNQPQFVIDFGSGHIKLNGNSILNTFKWYHIAGVYNGSEMKLYINGILDNSISQIGTITSYSSYSTLLGGWDGTRLLDGNIDEVRIWNVARSEEEIRQNMYCEYSDSTSDLSLIAYYQYNTNLGDQSANNNSGTFNGGTASYSTSSASFVPKTCLDFDGIDEYVSVGTGPASIKTVESWIYPTTNTEKILQLNATTYVEINEGALTSSGFISPTYFVDGVEDSTTVPAGKWSHIMVTTNTGINANIVELGRTGTSYFTGKLEEARIWSDVRTEEEIVENMCKNLTGNEDGLEAYYTFDNSSGDDLQDFSGNGNDGTLNNMANDDWVTSTSFNTWLNTSSTSWNTATNWSLGSAPNSSTVNVGIPDHATAYNPEASSDVAVNNLVVCKDAELTYSGGSHVIHGNVYNIGTTNINDDLLTITGSLYMLGGSKLYINPGGALTVEKNIYNRDGLFGKAEINIKSTSSGTGSLIIEGSLSNNGDTYCQRYIDDWNTGDGWHFLSSPVDNQSISPDFVNITDTISSSVDFYRWNESLDLWINIKKEDGTYNKGSKATNFSNETDPKFGVGLGYLVAYETDVTKTFSGTFNNYSPSKTELSYSPASSYTGAHLLGNPFPSALEWNKTEIEWNLTNVDATAKIWNSDGSGYQDIGALTNRIIPAMQGFMVIVNDAAEGSLIIYKGDRIHSNTSWYKNTHINVLKLTAYDPQGSKYQESVLAARDDASSGFDHQYDAPFFSGYAPLFYSWINEKPASSNAIPSFDDNLMIPFAFQKNESTDFYITIEGTENLDPAKEVFLIDHKLDQTFNLSANPIYPFSSQQNDELQRFTITFKTVGIDDQPTISNNIPILVWNSGNTLHISNPEQLLGNVTIVNLMGQTLIQTQLTGEPDQTVSLTLTEGLYVVQVQADSKSLSRKIVVTE